MLHVLVVGAGTMGSIHAAAFAKMKDVNLAGIVDTESDRAVKLAHSFETEAFQSYEEAVERLKQIDVVSICVPTPLHKHYIEKAADDSKHIICEKPLARTLVDAREIIEYYNKHNVKLFVGHVVRFLPEFARAKQMVEASKIGKPAVVRTSRGGAFPTGTNDWYTDFHSSGGVVVDLLIHDFDFLRWCFGEVERVYAKSSRGRVYERLEYVLVTLRFESGVMAHLEGTWAHDNFKTTFEIAGKEGVIDYDSSKAAPVVSSLKQTTGSGGVAVPESPLTNSPYVKELEHFVDCIQTGAEPIVSAEDAYRALEISVAALESIETGKAVTLDSTGKELA